MNKELLVSRFKNFFKWLLICLLGMVLLFLIGLLLGYGISSDHQLFNVFNQDVWNHLYAFFQ
ncbi:MULTISPECIES: DNA-directed RNA polymerase subunit beta [Aerococcus]|uniref:DNA-directed RNA polymerase subunit beta n=1 Tax=Aerococcus TaxID=1375 RepID=UPI0018A6EC38|nr:MULTISPECIES: DNA-directed RNA polymerase subunit beta [Aerococcus]MCY3035730.1 DNA-directed RNA polymerase subunit beta [Aerococcus sp. Group 2]MCY3039864.1 DNA-directed RNA polymerase subunit beta [Aerococcus sp. Group 2]MCY3040398.1 DNA-directed RNA polymerase subunit beta [Aerococcus sp. Group 2]MCY3043322.1 DNA-directed RNA polymerase subunit beta [Aerococcus sp. Group 2]MDK6519842.1 DNA-directed RNA polymerase subunit beta [Aerococcus urinae]